MPAHNIKFDMIIRGIIMTRGEKGATISEMREDYYKLMEKPWPLLFDDTDKIIQYFKEIDGLVMVEKENGLCIWYIDDIGENISERDSDINNNVNGNNENGFSLAVPQSLMLSSSFVSELNHLTNGINVINKRDLSINSSFSHISNGFNKQANNGKTWPLIEQNVLMHNENDIIKKKTSTEVDAVISIPEKPIMVIPRFDLQKSQGSSKSSFLHTESIDSTVTANETQLFPGVTFIGDHFLRSLISFELYSDDLTEKNDERFGYCFSGQTVRDAFFLILDNQRVFTSRYQYALLNIGANDILMERELIDIQAEYARLIRAVTTIGLHPIITTIPKLQVHSTHPNAKQIFQTLLLFNNFLSNTYNDSYHLIDLYSCLPHADKISYYQISPKRIKVGKIGKEIEIWPWNELGRKRIIETMESYFKQITDI